jgi:membrane protein DedA with SNARE-associated domain
MRLVPFVTFTAIGSGIWVVILAVVGYLIGNNRALLQMYLHRITLLLVIACFLAVAIYVAAIRQKRRKKSGKRNL